MNSFHARQSRPTAASKGAEVAANTLPRADVLLVQQGLAASRAEAQRLIAAGQIHAAGQLVTKPAQKFPNGTQFTRANSEQNRYVSRGGLKLAGALAKTGLSVTGRICLDIGQSTGGFTDCLLQAGAAEVIGIDVGHGQLHPRLQADSRVKSFAGINARSLSAADLGATLPPHGFDLIVADVSFISLTLILPRLPALLNENGNLLLLVKPQFEVGPAGIGKGGLVRNPALYAEVEGKLRTSALASRLQTLDWFESAITGSDGNREFFIWMTHEP
jgi:23S rRNA (cytidine1920-2'-O)/16S rRNA (cytidine1409-2'-O)-methyltransferase